MTVLNYSQKQLSAMPGICAWHGGTSSESDRAGLTQIALFDQVQAALTKSAPKPVIRRRKGIGVLNPDRIGKVVCVM